MPVVRQTGPAKQYLPTRLVAVELSLQPDLDERRVEPPPRQSTAGTGRSQEQSPKQQIYYILSRLPSGLPDDPQPDRLLV